MLPNKDYVTMQFLLNNTRPLDTHKFRQQHESEITKCLIIERSTSDKSLLNLRTMTL